MSFEMTSSCTSQPVAGGNMATLDRLGGVAAAAMQARTHMAGEREDCRHRLHIRLVMISNNRLRRDLRAC